MSIKKVYQKYIRGRGKTWYSEAKPKRIISLSIKKPETNEYQDFELIDMEIPSDIPFGYLEKVIHDAYVSERRKPQKPLIYWGKERFGDNIDKIIITLPGEVFLRVERRIKYRLQNNLKKQCKHNFSIGYCDNNEIPVLLN